MKIVVHAYPTEWLPLEVWHGLRNAIINVARAWGVDVDIEETMSVREAEVRANRPPSEHRLCGNFYPVGKVFCNLPAGHASVHEGPGGEQWHELVVASNG